jgi:Secretion system C-terminal sorting domain
MEGEMKKVAILLILVFAVSMVWGEIIITGLLDGDLAGGTPKAIEIYVSGTEDMANYSLWKSSNGGAFISTLIAGDMVGSFSNEFVYIIGTGFDGEIVFNSVFGTSGDYSNRPYVGSEISGNGDDGFQIRNSAETIVIDQVWTEDTIDSYKDSYWYRNNSTGPDGGWTVGNWTAGGNGALDGMDASQHEAAVPFGTYDFPLPVTLSSFTASYSKNAAVLNWITQSETDNLGFNLYRSENENGFDNSLSLNSTLISGMGTTSTPTNYSFADEYPVIEGHTYYYWLQSVSTSNDLELFGPVFLEIPIVGQLPTMTILESNYPNPFNPETTISFNIKENETGVLSIFNLKGEKVMKQKFEAGDHQYLWNAKGLSSGIYFYKLASPTTNLTRKMILMK